MGHEFVGGRDDDSRVASRLMPAHKCQCVGFQIGLNHFAHETGMRCRSAGSPLLLTACSREPHIFVNIKRSSLVMEKNSSFFLRNAWGSVQQPYLR